MLIIHFVTEKVDAAMVDGGMTKTKIISALCTGALDVGIVQKDVMRKNRR